MKTRLAFAAAALALAGCEAQSDIALTEPAPFAQEEIDGSLVPSAATIAMRWQWMNPDVNSFTFRNTQDVFAWRAVEAGADTRALPMATEEFALPMAVVDGEEADYAAWADRTFTNAFLVLRDGNIVFEDYRNLVRPKIISFTDRFMPTEPDQDV